MSESEREKQTGSNCEDAHKGWGMLMMVSDVQKLGVGVQLWPQEGDDSGADCGCNARKRSGVMGTYEESKGMRVTIKRGWQRWLAMLRRHANKGVGAVATAINESEVE